MSNQVFYNIGVMPSCPKSTLVRICRCNGVIGEGFIDEFDWLKTGSELDISHWQFLNPLVEVSAQPARNKYMREIKPDVWVDVYDVIRAFTVTDGALQHLLKKALAVGQRGHKDTSEDYKDILASAKRALEIFEEWSDEKS